MSWEPLGQQKVWGESISATLLFVIIITAWYNRVFKCAVPVDSEKMPSSTSHNPMVWQFDSITCCPLSCKTYSCLICYIILKMLFYFLVLLNLSYSKYLQFSHYILNVLPEGYLFKAFKPLAWKGCHLKCHLFKQNFTIYEYEPFNKRRTLKNRQKFCYKNCDFQT